MKKLLSLAGNIIFTALVLYLCWFIVQAAQSKAPDVFGYRLLRVMSDSMEPEFGSGDCIIVKETPPEELKVGDIITFFSEDPALLGGLNTHRIADIAKDHITKERIYYTKGDNNPLADDYTVRQEAVVGKYVYKLPFGQAVSSFLEKLSNRNYYFAFVMVPILLCFLSCIIQLAKDVRKKS